MDFIFVSIQRINTDRDSTSTCLAKELAKNHRVLYVNAPIDRKTYYLGSDDPYTNDHCQSIKEKNGEELKKLAPNLWVLNPSTIIESINWIPFTPVFCVFNRKNNVRFAKDIKEAIDELGFRNYIIINDKDIFRSFYLKEILKPEKYIYLDRDYTIGIDYWKRHGVSLEPALMEKSDAIVCNSYDFTKRARQYNPNSFYIGNGFDAEQYDHRQKKAVPSDLKEIPGPRIGYVGALITLRLDLNLMIELAKARPSWSFVLIGWEDESFERSELHELANVYFLGRKHTKEVPAYIQHFDVCINPQILNEITRGNFPLKVVEYLALGKPVVGTATNTMNEVFSEHTYLAKDKEGYVQQIEKALAEDSPSMQQERLSFVRSFSWENVANLLLEAISKKDTVASIP
jgi:teichuronic acid biosynthesis glycosyltransferase TuaH